MSEYDSILKDKKKKQVVSIEEKKKKFPVFFLSMVLIIILLVASYILYYNSVLNSKEVFINNINSLLDKYDVLMGNIPIKEFREENNLMGSITYNEEVFNFNLIKNNRDLNFNISNNDKYFNYFILGDKEYANIKGVESNINLDNNKVKSMLEVMDKFLAINIDKYVKRIYLDGVMPVVEVNLVLDTNDINELFKLSLKNNYQVIVTMRNDAIKNEIKDIKVVINNLDKVDRRVIFITDEEIVYKNKDITYKVVLERNNDNFNLKINKNDNLYSTLVGNKSEDSYSYVYQLINDSYKIEVDILKTGLEYSYDIVKIENEEEKSLKVNVLSSTRYIIETNYDTVLDREDETIKDIYNEEFNYFKDRYLDFIK